MDEGRLKDGEEAKNNETLDDGQAIKTEEKMEIKTLMSDFSSAQTQLHARIVACETENALLLFYFSIMHNLRTTHS